MPEMTPRGRVEAVLRGQRADRVPFIIWDNKLPDGALGQAVLAAEACVIVKSGILRQELRTIDCQEQVSSGRDGRTRRRTTYHTAAGELTTTAVVEPWTVWREEPLFKSPADYDALLALAGDREYTSDYERFLADDRRYGDSGLARPATEKSPLFELMYDIMGLATFALEWHERRGRVLELYRALAANQRKRLAILADSPAQYAVVEGNVDFSVVGAERFKEHYAPAIRSACELMHARGKIAGAHLDGNNARWAELVAPLPLDLIESFTPPPDCDMPLADALRLWPGKVLMVHFPSSIHLAGPDAVRAEARRLLAEHAGCRRIILGEMEDVPCNDALPILAETVRDFGRVD